MIKKPTPAPKPLLDVPKLLSNAVSSIQLGVEDFQNSLGLTGNPLRALSAARNLYAGALLLFKYRIASFAKNSEQAAELIFETKTTLPKLNDKNEIHWQPNKPNPNKTIDVNTIKDRFESLQISTNWKSIDTLKRCRNALEHLHPEHSTGEITNFLANLFPLLQDFIRNELNEKPLDLLGEAWEVMLKYHEFHASNITESRNKWLKAGFPETALELLGTAQCECCGSLLLEPHEEDIERALPIGTTEFRYSCIACHYDSSITELIESEFSLANNYSFNYTDGSYCTADSECGSCAFHLFSRDEGFCIWCGHTETIPVCSECNTTLRDYEAEHGRLCDRCQQDMDHYEEYEASIR
ncbi:hypothetical protein GCM10008969_58070 [Pseudomonas veronii subsp. inensis]|uniref:hypothetical protein n=1 Tax=Pseudomonas veronii TaxID=76761 RepID=UPI0031F95C73